ncbi:MAG: M23 family metallopeptidase [Frankia sp.]|nr:M23 family metallopeptidase [Frankia sp.]
MVHNSAIAHSAEPGDHHSEVFIRPLYGSAAGIVAAAAPKASSGDPLIDLMSERLIAHQFSRASVLSGLSDQLAAQREAALAEEAERRARAHWVRPIEARVTQRFSASRHHFGIDFGAALGTPIVAAHRGKVIYAGWQSGYGNVVLIEHEDNVVTLYGHMSRMYVRVGQQVDTGQQIGAEGNTGRSTGPHLHFEVRLGGADGSKVDPLAWLAAFGVTY